MIDSVVNKTSMEGRSHNEMLVVFVQIKMRTMITHDWNDGTTKRLRENVSENKYCID